jgi:hypothetical protein
VELKLLALAIGCNLKRTAVEIKLSFSGLTIGSNLETKAIEINFLLPTIGCN